MGDWSQAGQAAVAGGLQAVVNWAIHSCVVPAFGQAQRDVAAAVTGIDVDEVTANSGAAILAARLAGQGSGSAAGAG